MLSDAQIMDAMRWRGLGISSFDERCLQAASYDVHLHPDVRVLADGEPLDPKRDSADRFALTSIPEGGFIITPGMLVLASTLERFDLGNQIMAQLEGKSSLGRLGLIVHSTAGYIDPGFAGQVTLELGCVHSSGIKIYPGMPIGQIAFMRCASVTKPYAGKYMQQHGPTSSRYHLNWDGEQWVA